MKTTTTIKIVRNPRLECRSNTIVSLSGRTGCVYVDNKTLRVGDRLADDQVDELFNISNYDVTVTVTNK